MTLLHDLWNYILFDQPVLYATHAIVSHIGRYGSPSIIRTDPGSQFDNDMLSSLLEHMVIEHDITIADSKQENAIVERSNKEVMRHL